MRYKEYIWPNEAKDIRISYIKETNMNYALLKDRIESYMSYRLIDGRGEFYGKDCYESFMELTKIYMESTSGILVIDRMSPIRAYFLELSLTGLPAEDVLEYKFRFVEDISRMKYKHGTKKCKPIIYTIKKGESLWEVSNMLGINIGDILAKNPELSNPYDVYDGLKIKI